MHDEKSADAERSGASPVRGEGATPSSAAPASGGAASIPASKLAGPKASVVSADVALDAGEPLVGSFTADGLTYSVGPDGLALVSADPAVPDGSVSIPESVAYDGTTYPVTAIGSYAFYLSGATDVVLPASIASVDDRAFRSSDVECVEVDPANESFASYDGALYSAGTLRLLLIPGGRQGAVRISSTAEEVDTAAFSHCAGVDAISADAGSANFASWDGLLYDASGETLLRVPAGATEMTIRDGCTTIAAGAMEGCASLERIHAPATVASISPDVFASVPTVSLPAASLSEDAPQLTAMVALSAPNDDVLEIDIGAISVMLPFVEPDNVWNRKGFPTASNEEGQTATLQQSSSERAGQHQWFLYANLGAWYATSSGNMDGELSFQGQSSDPATVSRVETIVDSDIRYEGPYIYAYWNDTGRYYRKYYVAREGYLFAGWSTTFDKSGLFCGPSEIHNQRFNSNFSAIALWEPAICTVSFDLQGGTGSVPSVKVSHGAALPSADCSVPKKQGYIFKGFYEQKNGGGTRYYDEAGAVNQGVKITNHTTLYACWEEIRDRDISFNTSSEPGDVNYPGNEKPDQTVTGSQIEAGDKVLVENPKRPGYVFQGWVIPSADGTEAIDQELVYQDEADGKWYVDASKLPGYAGDDGRVELTARWTAALSVDAPISATFMYDLSQWDGSQARDAYVEGSSTVKNRSAVPIRVSGIESSKGGSASVLKKADGTALDDAAAARAAKVLSVFPTASDATGTEGDAKAPASDDAADDMAHKVDLSLDDVLLERSFDADAWAVDAATVGDNGVTVSTGDLKLGYRLNLGGSTGVTLDQDALLAVTGEPEGAGPSEAAPIANLAYCFAAEGLLPTGTKADPLWVEVTDPEVGGVGVYGLSDIKRAADDFSARVDPSTDPNDWDSIKSQISGSPYAKLFIELLEGGAPFKLKVGSSWQNIQILGICQDTRSSDGRKAGLSFGFQDVWAGYGKDCLGNAVATYINPDWQSQPGLYGWAGGQPLRDTYLRGTFANLLDVRVRSSIAEVWKTQQKAYGESASSLQRSKETIFLPSLYEVEGRVCKDSRPDFSSYTLNAAERYTVQGSVPFQYQLFKKGSASNPKVKHWQGAAKPWYTRSAQSFNYNGAGNQNWIWCIMRSDGSPQVAGCYDVEFATIVPAFCL